MLYGLDFAEFCQNPHTDPPDEPRMKANPMSH